MSRSSLLLSVLLLTLTFQVLPPASDASSPLPPTTSGPQRVTHDYRVELDQDCVAAVRVFLRSENATAVTWVLIPRTSNGFETNGSVIGVEAASQNSSTPSLYRNVTVLLRPEAPVELGYSFPNACLVLGGRAVFLSPLLRLPSGATGTVSVSVRWPGASLKEVDGTSSRVTRLPDGFVVERALPLMSDRLSFTFSVPSEELREVTDGPLTFVLPDRYREVAQRLFQFYVAFDDNLTSLFPQAPGKVKVKFFLPERHDEGPEGYVRFNGGGGPGEISLNLYLLRMVDGMLEVTFMHELIHHYLFANGVGAGATWFHEGLATYLSVKMAGVAGLEASTYLRATFDRFGTSTASLRELLVWRPGESRGSRLYAMAYFAFEKLFEIDSTGMVTALRSLGRSQLTTPDDAVEYLFDHLNPDALEFLVDSGLAVDGVRMLSQEIDTDSLIHVSENSTYTGGRKIENKEQLGTALQLDNFTVNVLVIALVVVTVVIVVIDSRRA